MFKVLILAKYQTYCVTAEYFEHFLNNLFFEHLTRAKKKLKSESIFCKKWIWVIYWTCCVTDCDSFLEDKKWKLINDAKWNDKKTNEIYLSIFTNLFNWKQSFSKSFFEVRFQIDVWYFLRMETRNCTTEETFFLQNSWWLCDKLHLF